MRRAILLLVLTCLPLGAARADVYRSVDAQGHVQYSDVPTPGAQRVPDIAADVLNPAPASTSSASNASASQDLQKPSEEISQRLASQAAARAVQRDMAQARAEQCKQAQSAYQKSIQARRIYKVGPDGQRQYLSDQQADQQRIAARLAMETACKQSS